MLLEGIKISKSVRNGNEDKVILNQLDIKIEEGTSIAIKGRSGSGKSTLLNILAGLLNIDDGKIYFNGKDISQRSINERASYRMNNIGYVTQQFHLLDDRNVFENIALPLQYNGMTNKEIKVKVDNVLSKLKMQEFRDKEICNLSGGERQRIALARALIKNPKIILADEPTGALDLKTEAEILEIFRNLNKEGITLVIVTHDESVARCCKEIYELIDGKLIKK